MALFSSPRPTTEVVDEDWPPRFQTFAEYKAELDDAIAAHPPFGRFLRQYRNINHLLEGENQQPCMWHMSVAELKERYMKAKEIETRCKNAKRYFAEVYLHDGMEKYALAEEQHESAVKAHEQAVAKWDELSAVGVRNLPRRPPVPRPTNDMQEKEKLLRMCQD